MERFKNFFLNFILPVFLLPCIVGFVAGISTFFYKWGAEELNEIALIINKFVLEHLWMIPIMGLSFAIIAFWQAHVIKHAPVAKGGGIPTSEGIIRGSISFHPVMTMILTIVLSAISFVIGLPLGCEGPSVSIGTALGEISSMFFKKRGKGYERYLMTAGASSAFSVATGAPITGIIFALEEIHRKFSPIILIVSFSSVVCGSLIARLLSGWTGISYALFEFGTIKQLDFNQYWLLIPLGVLIGIIAICFSRLVRVSQHIQDKNMKKVPAWIKILISFSITLLIGLFLPEFLNGGRGLVLKSINNEVSFWILVILLVLKLIMTSWISQSGVTGGMFIPILTIGALIGAILAKICNVNEYAPLIIAISMAAFMAASVGCPLSALVFSFEALGANTNILAFAITVLLAYLVTRLFNTIHIYDVVLERKLQNDYGRKQFKLIEVPLIVNDDSFAANKQVRDLLLSANNIILSIKRVNKDYGKMDNFGDKLIHPEDVITFRCQTYNIEATQNELESFFGTQEEFIYTVIQE